MKKQLIKEVDINGRIWYWIEINHNRVSSFFNNLEEANKFFEAIKTNKPLIEVIKEDEI